ncbi:hypothetical protein [Planotetraspora kaengkrachanensis]|uniref:hypothetical protein n=1 Tax=Planotetraspora kaengkrachanensis TaxID=575193 RepID=UPI00194530C7|nr:hypothetical protein [Planotetraspora kaengkrachanensis]
MTKVISDVPPRPEPPRIRITLPAETVALLSAWGAFVRRNGVTLAALLLLVLQLWWRAEVVSLAYFKEDDFEFAARAVESPLSWDYLTRVHYGQFMPVGFALAWFVTRLAPYSWGLAAGSTLILFTVSGLAVFRMLLVLFGRRRAILVPLAVYLFAPFTVPALTWWSAALNLVPLLIAIPMAIISHVLHLRDGRLLHAVAATAWLVVALCSFLKAAALPLLLFALTLAYFSDGGGVRGVLRRHAGLWATYAAVVVAYVVGYLVAGRDTADMSGWPTPAEGLGFIKKLLLDTFLGTTLGGPWKWFSGPDRAVASPPALLVGLAAVVALALLVVTARYRRRALRAWGLLLGYLVVADIVPTYYGRVHILGAFHGMETRYIVDAAPVLALVVGAAILPLAGEDRPYRARPPRDLVTGAGGLLLGGFLVGSLASVSVLSGYLGNDRAHAYLTTAAASLRSAPPDAVILDRRAPGDVISAAYGEYAMTSRVLAPLATPAQRERMRDPAPSTNAMVVDDQGRLRAADGSGERTAAPGGCYPVAGAGVEIPLPQVPQAGAVVRIGYSSAASARAVLYLGDRRHDVTIGQGLGRILFVAPANLQKVLVSGLPMGAQICFGDVAVGDAVPAS